MIIRNVFDLTNSLIAAKEGLFSSVRYPFTYAYDFYRTHQADFPDSPQGAVSRNQASHLIRAYAKATNQDYLVVLVALADGYMESENIGASLQQRADALADTMSGVGEIPAYRHPEDPTVVITRDEAIAVITDLGLPVPNAR